MHDSSDKRDLHWVQRVRSGDREAFSKLFHAYVTDLCNFAAQYVEDPTDAEDIIQEVFCDLWNRRASWYPETSVRAYLFRAARNTALDRLKHNRVRRAWKTERKRASQYDYRSTPADTLQHRELKQAMREAVETLPKRRRLVYRMVRHQGMSYKEVAEVLDIAPKTVENQMGRALKTLRKRLSKFAAQLQ